MEKKLKLIIVEDDPQICEIVEKFVKTITYYEMIAVINNIKDASEFLRVCVPDLILLDVFFDDGNGIDLLREVRTRGLASDVILITAEQNIKAFQKAMRFGVRDYILKPVNFTRFKKTLENHYSYYLKMQGMHTVIQSDVDVFFKNQPASSSKTLYPKGIDPITLEKIIKLIEHNRNKEFYSNQVGEDIGLSRTTARRYLEYLVSVNRLTADLSYKATGRPERKYIKIATTDKPREINC